MVSCSGDGPRSEQSRCAAASPRAFRSRSGRAGAGRKGCGDGHSLAGEGWDERCITLGCFWLGG